MTRFATLYRNLSRATAWMSRHLGATLATTLLFVSSASAFSLLEAFH